METRCGNCSARLTVPDEKLAGPGPYRVLCPKCRKEIRLDGEGGRAAPEKTSPSAQSGNAAAGAGSFHPLGKGGGERVCLLLEADTPERESVRQAVEASGFRAVTAKDAREAIGRLRFHEFDLLLLSERFDDTTWEDSPILNYINTMSMAARRRMLVALIGDDLPTRDPMTAFSLSVNVVIGRGDVGELKRILEAAVAEQEAFYSVFMKLLAETGKA